MIASALICSLPFLALGRVRESGKTVAHLQTGQNLQTMQKNRNSLTARVKTPITGVCNTANSLTSIPVFQDAAACQADPTATNGLLYVPNTIIDAASCASDIASTCNMVTSPAAVSYSPNNGNPICVWFASCSVTTDGMITDGNVQFTPTGGGAVITVAASGTNGFMTHSGADAGIALVTDTQAMQTSAEMTAQTGLAQSDEQTVLADSPEQIQAEQQGETAATVQTMGTSIGQAQQDCPDDYKTNMDRGEWQCVKRQEVGAMVLIGAAGATVFIITCLLTCGIGYKLRNKDKDGDEEGEGPMAGEFEEEEEEEEEEELG